jgi:hypothetical protein
MRLTITKAGFCLHQWLFVSLLVMLTYAMATPGYSAAAEKRSFVDVKGNLLTVRAENVPLNQLLAEIARQTSIQITLYTPAENGISTDLSDIPLEQGLKRLVRDFSSAFVYGDQTGQAGEPKITKLVLYAKAGHGLRPGQMPSTISPRRNNIPTVREPQTPPSQPQGREAQDQDYIDPEEGTASPMDSEDDREIFRLGAVLVRDKDEDARAEAAQALGEIGDEKALIPLIQALKDRNVQVRETAITALCEIGGEHVVKALEGCLSDQDQEVQKAAEQALSRLEEGK